MGHDNVFGKVLERAERHHDHDHDHDHDHGHQHHHHDHESAFGINLHMAAIFGGGLLLIVAMVAKPLFATEPFRADMVALVAALILAAPLVVAALRNLLTGGGEMNELVSLAVVAAISMGKFLEAGIIAFFMILSSLIEHRTAMGARKSIESLIRITPTRATRVVDGREEEVDAKELKPGDVVRVRPGDNIPGDGRVMSGTSSVNQANVTGESLPQDKAVNDDVFGGTINLTGVLEVQITKAGRDTTLGRVQDLILQAEQTRMPVMRLADRYARWYTPVVLMLAGIVFFFTHDMNRVIAMLLVSCPCAIILSTPTAMVAALSAAARLGLLVKKVTDLEIARSLTAIVLDKTGTLTTGKLNVTRLRPVEGVTAEELLRAALAVEQNSRHPVARAIVEVAERARLTAAAPTDFEEASGRGVRGTVDGATVLVGRSTWLAEQGVDVESVDASGTEGLSLLYVAQGGKVLGWIGLEDKTRPDAARAIGRLGELGVRQRVMLTGDRWSVARKVAAEMNCTDLKAEVLPGEKLAAVDQLRSMGHTVAVVGDGVNDAPALAAGDISIAMGAAGSDVAIHSASIALMNNNLNRIPFLVQLSRRCFEIIRQNMVFGVVYVVLTLSLSAAGYVEPILAAFMHTGSSLIVVFNSTRLVRQGEDLDQQAFEQEQRERRPTVRLEAVGASA